MMYGSRRIRSRRDDNHVNQDPEILFDSLKTIPERQSSVLTVRSTQGYLKKTTRKILRQSTRNFKRAIITITVILFWISIQTLQVAKAEVATYQDNEIAIYVTYRLGAWTIVARNGTKVTERFNVTVYPRNPKLKITINNKTVEWGQTIIMKAQANRMIILNIQYDNRTIRLVFNVISSKQAKEELKREYLTLSIKEFLSLKSRYFIIGAIAGVIAVGNAWLVRRRGLLLDIKSVIGMDIIFVFIAFMINAYVSSRYQEPQYYWLAYAFSLIISSLVIPPPKGIYIVTPELSKRNINLDYYVVYKDRRGIPRIAEQSVSMALRRILG
ncbi:MAG: hypothetical protein ACTSVA_01370, partial [Candidatus Njordarchaeales archaeon]